LKNVNPLVGFEGAAATYKSVLSNLIVSKDLDSDIANEINSLAEKFKGPDGKKLASKLCLYGFHHNSKTGDVMGYFEP
jgi:hypothetical protein